MKHMIALCLALASAGAYASGTCTGTFPDGTRPVCSVTFNLLQTCVGGETVMRWNITGPTGAYPAGKWWITPWMDADINIVKVELVELYNDGHLFYMLGNNSQGDPMVWMGPTDYHVISDYTPGTSWRFPASSRAAASDYIDLHGWCAAGKPADVRLTFFYTVSP